MHEFKLLAGNGNRQLAEKIALELGVPLADACVTEFSDGETNVVLNETVRGSDIFVLQPTGPPANRNLIELLFLLEAAKRCSAKKVSAIVPYFGYARQDRMVKRSPVSARLAADLIQVAGADHILSMDLHSASIEGFFKIPVDNVSAMPLLAEHFKKKSCVENAVVVSPDVGGVKRARIFASFLGLPIAIIDKVRPKPNESEVAHVVGDVEGKCCIMIDDMVDTAGSLSKAARVLDEKGASGVYAAATHGVLSGPAFELVEKSPIKELVVTDTLALREGAPSKITQLSVAPLIAEAIRRMYAKQSLTELFQLQGAKP